MSEPGFVQIIEFRTERIDEIQALAERWAEAIGAKRTAMGATVCADRDHPGSFLQIVEFPSYEAAMDNSEHPATADFAEQFRAMCDGEPVFLNLDAIARIAF